MECSHLCRHGLVSAVVGYITPGSCLSVYTDKVEIDEFINVESLFIFSLHVLWCVQNFRIIVGITSLIKYGGRYILLIMEDIY